MFKYRLELWNRCVLFQVLEQDELWRGLGTLFVGGLKVCSVRNVELEKSSIYLRGVRFFFGL